MKDVNLLAAEFLDALTEAQKERPRRGYLVENSEGWPECAWASHERSVMQKEINRYRSDHGGEPVSLAEVERVEAPAVGHSDYSQKFALYCAELAMGAERNMH